MAAISMTHGYLHWRHKENSINRTLVVYHLQKLSRKSVWKVNGTRLFRSLVSVEHIPEQWNIWKGSLLVLPVAISKQTFVFHFFKAIFDTGFSFPRPFFGITVTVSCKWWKQLRDKIYQSWILIIIHPHHIRVSWWTTFLTVQFNVCLLTSYTLKLEILVKVLQSLVFASLMPDWFYYLQPGNNTTQ